MLHLGWPKTASTFLQRSIFRQDQRIEFIGKPDKREQTRRLKDFLRDGGGESGDGEIDGDEPFVSLRATEEARPLVLSSENFFTSTGRIACGSGPRLAKVARGIDKLRMFCGPGVDLKVLLCFRRQDEWLIANYAEQANREEPASQRNLEERVAEILAGRMPRRKYLEYDRWLEELEKRVGRGIVCPMIFEDLSGNPERMETVLEDAIGLEYRGRIAREIGNPVWARRQGAREWRLRLPDKGATEGLARTVTLTDDLSARIMREFQANNRRFGEYLGRDLGVYGYYGTVGRAAVG